MYKAKVMWNGNHYFAGETVRGSKVRRTDTGWELFDDEEPELFDENGEPNNFPYVSRDEWVEVVPESIEEE